MTLIIAVRCKDACVIGSDGRVVRLDEYRTEEKIFQIGEHLLVGLAGSTGVIKRIVKALNNIAPSLKNEESIGKIESKLAEIYRHHLEVYAENYKSNEEFNERFYGHLLAIDDENIYTFFFDGYPEPCSDYEAIGSASGYVRTLLETFYEKDIDGERAKDLIVYCILQAMKVSRDIGEPIQVGIVRKGGRAEILPSDKVEEIVKKINGRERILHDVWNLLSRKPEIQNGLEKFIEEKSELLPEAR